MEASENSRRKDREPLCIRVGAHGYQLSTALSGGANRPEGFFVNRDFVFALNPQR